MHRRCCRHELVRQFVARRLHWQYPSLPTYGYPYRYSQTRAAGSAALVAACSGDTTTYEYHYSPTGYLEIKKVNDVFDSESIVGDQECCDAIANQPNDSASLQAACSTNTVLCVGVWKCTQ